VTLRRASLLLTFLAFSVPATAADWKYLTSSSTDTAIFVDVDSVRTLPPIPIKRPFAVRQIWVKSDHSKDASERDRESKSMHRFDCDAETMLLVSHTSYRPDGTVSDSFDKEDYEFNYKPVTPDSVGYALMEFACGRRSIKPQYR